MKKNGEETIMQHYDFANISNFKEIDMYKNNTGSRLIMEFVCSSVDFVSVYSEIQVNTTELYYSEEKICLNSTDSREYKPKKKRRGDDEEEVLEEEVTYE